ncbi:MAG TPA: glycosyltransferase, partial [Cytophagales bacterium]
MLFSANKPLPIGTPASKQSTESQLSGNGPAAPQISIVVPLYNEVETFAHLVERLNKLIAAVELTIEVVLIDDGSSDGT